MVRNFLRETYQTTLEFSPNARWFLLSAFLSWTGLSVHQVLFNLYLTEGGFREEFIGPCVSLMGLAMGLVALPAGLLSDRIGRRACLLAGSIGLGASFLARALTLDPQLLLVASFAVGAFNALVAISTSPFLSENSETHVRTALFSAHFIVLLAAGVTGNLLGGQIPELLAHHVPLSMGKVAAYRSTLAGGGILTALASWPLLLVRERAPVLGEVSDPVGWREAGAPMSKLALNYFLIGSGAGFVIPFFNLYFARRFGCTSGQIGLFFSVSQVITAAAALAGPPLARRFGLRKTVAGLQLASLPFLVTLGLERSLGVAVVSFWARASLMQTSSPLQNAFAMEVVPPSMRALTTGLTNTVWYLGWAASASLSGWILARYGYEYPYYLTAILYATATIAFYRMFRSGAARTDPVRAAATAS